MLHPELHGCAQAELCCMAVILCECKPQHTATEGSHWGVPVTQAVTGLSPTTSQITEEPKWHFCVFQHNVRGQEPRAAGRSQSAGEVDTQLPGAWPKWHRWKEKCDTAPVRSSNVLLFHHPEISQNLLSVRTSFPGFLLLTSHKYFHHLFHHLNKEKNLKTFGLFFFFSNLNKENASSQCQAVLYFDSLSPHAQP